MSSIKNSNLNINTNEKRYNQNDYYTDIANLQEIAQDDVENPNFTETDDKGYEEHYQKMIRKLNKEAVIDMAWQILNYRDNDLQGGSLPVVTLFENCSMVLQKIIKNNVSKNDFERLKKSLDNSQFCITHIDKYKEKIVALDNNDKKSFVMAPLVGMGHLFSVAIYKKDDNYEFVVVNKGGRYDNAKEKEYHMFEKYIVPKEKIDDAVKIFQDIDDGESRKRPVEYVYNHLEEISSKHISLTNIDAREQRVGNCYFKEIEEVFKLVVSEAFDEYEKNEYIMLNGSKVEKLTPKFPIKTQKMHEELLDNLELYSDDKEVKEAIKEIKDVYIKNKNFREKMDEYSNLDRQEKEKILMNIFENDDVMECLKKVDERTLQDHIDFFIDVLKSRGCDIPTIMYNARYEALAIDFNDGIKGYLEDANRYGELKLLGKYFPKIASQLENNINKDKVDKIIHYIQKVYNSDEYTSDIIRMLCREALLLNINRKQECTIKKYLGLCEVAEGDYKKALIYFKESYDVSMDTSQRRITRDLYNETLREMKDRKVKLENTIKPKEKLKSLEVLGKLDEALNLYNKMLKRRIVNIEDKIFLLKGKAILLERMGKREDSKDTYQLAIKNLEIIQDKKANDFNYWKTKGDILRVMGNFNDAMVAYKMGKRTLYNTTDIARKEDNIKLINNAINNLEIKRDVMEDIVQLENERRKEPYNIDEQIRKYKNPDIYNEKSIKNLNMLASKLEVLGRREEALDICFDVLDKVNNDESFDRAMRLLRVTRKSKEALNNVEEWIDLEDSKPDDEKMTPKDYIALRIKRYELLRDIGEKEEAIREASFISVKLRDTNYPKELREGIRIERLKINVGLAQLLQEVGDKKNALKVYQNINDEFIKDSKIAPRIITKNMKLLSKELQSEKNLKKDKAPLVKQNEMAKSLEKVGKIANNILSKDIKNKQRKLSLEKVRKLALRAIGKKEPKLNSKIINKAITKDKNGLLKIKQNRIVSKLIHKIRQDKIKINNNSLDEISKGNRQDR